MYGKLYLLIIFLVLAAPVFSLQINEIMYNPNGTDTDHEWVEIYNNDTDTYNITGWKFRTGSTDHALNVPPANGGQGSMLIAANSYLVIVQDAATFLSNHVGYSGAVIDSSWSDLSNTANNTIVLKNSTVVFSNVTFSPSAAEGNTICLISSMQECASTPGAANILFVNATTSNSTANSTANSTDSAADAKISVYMNSAHVNGNYSLFLIEINNKTCSNLDNVTVNYNITPSLSSSFVSEVGCSAYAGSWTPQSAGNYTVCGSINVNDTNLANNAACKTISVADMLLPRCNVSVSIDAGSVYNSSVAINYKILLNDTICSQENTIQVEYWIEDLFGNYVKDKLNTTQSMLCTRSIDRQWTPPSIVGSEAYRIVTVMSAGCDISTLDNLNEKLIVIKGQSAALADQSSQSSPQTTGNVSDNIEIISYPQGIFIDDPFEIIVKVSNASSKKFSVYSYVYDGNSPISQGFNGSLWKGSWDANKKEVEDENGALMIELKSRIENGTAPGIYNLKVKTKGDFEYEIKKTVNVTGEKPKIEIKKFNNTVRIDTACEDCEILVIGPEIESLVKKPYVLENVSGIFHILLLRNSKILSKYSVNLTKIETAPVSNKTLGSTSVTGFASKKSSINIARYVMMIQIFSKMKLF